MITSATFFFCRISAEEFKQGIDAGVVGTGDSLGAVIPEVNEEEEMKNTTWDLCVVLPVDVKDDKVANPISH